MFLVKVYSILAVMLAITSIFCAIVMGSSGLQSFIHRTPALHWAFLGTGVALLLTLLCPCCLRCQRKVPFNYILLLAFTICWTYMVGGFVSYFEPASVLCTAVSTLGMFLGLTVFAMTMSDDQMSFLGGVSISLFFVAIPVIIFSLMFRSLFIYMIV